MEIETVSEQYALDTLNKFNAIVSQMETVGAYYYVKSTPLGGGVSELKFVWPMRRMIHVERMNVRNSQPLALAYTRARRHVRRLDLIDWTE